MNQQDKVRGAFLGLAIGDALGKPVETFKYEKIVDLHGRVDKYLSNSGHKWFDGHMEGTWTDDTQLSLAIARAMIRAGDFDLDAIAEEQVKEFKANVKGWGGSTREALARIAAGTHWSESGKTDKPRRGTGNGICMKVAPIGIHMALKNPTCQKKQWEESVSKLVKLSTMTHYTSMAITSGLAHAFATFKCFTSEPKTFDRQSFVKCVCGAGMMGRQYLPSTLTEDDISNRFAKLENYELYTGEKIIEDFGGGSCYVYDSLPFTYLWFLKNPDNIESLYDCVTAGGDTDTNGSMLGTLLGALHGTGVFPQYLVDGLDQKDMIIELADQFYEKFSK